MPNRKSPRVSESVDRVGAAAIAGVTEGAIRAAINRGDLQEHASADGRRTMLAVADVERWRDDPERKPRGRPSS